MNRHKEIREIKENIDPIFFHKTITTILTGT